MLNDQQGNQNSHEQSENNSTKQKVAVEVSINGQRQVVELTPEEIARHYQLSESSTQRFQEASRLREEAQKISKVESSNNEQESKKSRSDDGDYGDEVYREINRLKKLNEDLKTQFESVSQTIVSHQNAQSVKSLSQKYGVTEDFIKNEVMPVMADKGIGDLDIAVKSVMFDKNIQRKTSITSDSGYRPDNSDVDIEDAFGKSMLQSIHSGLYSDN